MTRQEKAIGYFDQGFNCSQSVLTAFSKELNMPEDDLLKISCAFGGGMGRRQLTCGAVSGALMALGLHYGRGSGDDISKKTFTYEKADEFMTAFELRNGSVNCRDLLQGLNMNDPEDMKKIESLGLFKTSCYKYAKDAVEIVEQMITTIKPVI
ncbi:MAG: C-GCAxxG-C-C family protein [Bacteroidales bacterium]|nr:C-GCAxxG-C-C family protein [Bacteroidales bacterium]